MSQFDMDSFSFLYFYKEWRSSNHLVKDEKCRDAVEHLKVVGPRNGLPSDEVTVGNRVANGPHFFSFLSLSLI